VFLASEIWDRVTEFVERDPDVAGAFRFRHALIRDAAYEGLSFRRRRELHGRVGLAYEERHVANPEEIAEILALHFSRAREDSRTWQYGLLAGDRARAKYANAEAATFYRLALKAAGSVEGLERAEVRRVWVALSDVCLRAGRLSEAGASLAQARKLLPKDAPEQTELLLKEGHVREVSGRYSEALRWYARARRAAQELADESQRARLLVELALATAGVRNRQGAYMECIGWCKRALDEADALGDLQNAAHAYYLLHLAYTSLASPEREAYRGVALPIYEELGDLEGQAKTLNNMGVDAYYEGRWDNALDVWRLSKDLMDRMGDVLGAATLTNNIGEILSDQGRLDQAVELFEEVRRVTDAAGERLLSTVARGNLGRAAARSGRLDEAEELLQTAAKGFDAIHAASFALETQARLAEVAVMATGRHEEALAQAEATLEQVRAAGATAALVALLERIRGYALLQAGHRPDALEAFEASLVAARAGGVDYEVALTLNALAAAGTPNAEELAVESGRILIRLGVESVPRVPLP
jgi:tetratricopeptide (TPR) repeat protein